MRRVARLGLARVVRIGKIMHASPPLTRLGIVAAVHVSNTAEFITDWIDH